MIVKILTELASLILFSVSRRIVKFSFLASSASSFNEFPFPRSNRLDNCKKPLLVVVLAGQCLGWLAYKVCCPLNLGVESFDLSARHNNVSLPLSQSIIDGVAILIRALLSELRIIVTELPIFFEKGSSRITCCV